MASTSYGVNHPLAVKLWAKELFEEAIKQTWFARFLGNDSNSLIQVKSETSKGPGDRVRVGLRMLLTGSGIQGDDTLEGNEEALVTYYQDTVINQLRHAVRSAGKMSEQRVPFDVRNEAKQGLADWWAERIEKSLAHQLTGNTVQTDTRFTGNNATAAPSSNNVIYGNSQTVEGSVSSSTTTVNAQVVFENGFNLTQIDRAIVKARTNTPKIRPLKIAGDEMFVAFLHPYQVYQLRTSVQTGQWVDIQKSAMAGMDSKSSPIFTGALGIYNGVVIHECPYIPTGVVSGQANVIRAVFGGAQSAVMAYGQGSGGGSMDWNEKLFDYGNQLGVESGMIFGCQKTTYNSQDFATIALSTYSPAP